MSRHIDMLLKPREEQDNKGAVLDWTDSESCRGVNVLTYRPTSECVSVCVCVCASVSQRWRCKSRLLRGYYHAAEVCVCARLCVRVCLHVCMCGLGELGVV